jgi:hypothetical protein
VTAPAGANYVAGYSQIIPPKSGPSTAAFSVPSCPSSVADVISRYDRCSAKFSLRSSRLVHRFSHAAPARTTTSI